ncbi:hypothetical protein DFH08DRAFT_385380 [Mycena albidolilacea]|uniref:Secreted protein n=1 Tax=Mycena albidolilacea TaxID=1033008 RepID=A0AAD6ZFZ6_9AGAR|nr:hypothetical protein DFH08DRAFT_385380 [Mycena albidolilacea]
MSQTDSPMISSGFLALFSLSLLGFESGKCEIFGDRCEILTVLVRRIQALDRSWPNLRRVRRCGDSVNHFHAGPIVIEYSIKSIRTGGVLYRVYR